MKDLKYLAAYINPALTTIGLLAGGIYTFFAVIFTFVLVPSLEPFTPNSSKNLSKAEREKALKNKVFDYLLYLNLPVLYGILILFMYTLNHSSMTHLELLGNILSVGIVLGTCGINVGHELGHRKAKKERLMAKILLLPALYTHFFIEHNKGHHKHVATDRDPASARLNENLYAFWIRSTFGGYRSAWQLEAQRLANLKLSFWSLKNEMLVFLLLQVAYLALVASLTSLGGFMAFLGAAVVGILLLETVNYIEHYGLRRKLLPSGKYERVLPKHSWNANYQLGRIVLYELTRHSDHHYKASKKYQILDHYDEAPELPFGYPVSMVIAFFPPLWYKLMNGRIPL